MKCSPGIIIVLMVLINGCADLHTARKAYNNQNYELAHQYWSELAEKGFPEAEYWLGKLYEHGYMGSDKKILSNEHYQRAADLGHHGAMYSLGKYFLKNKNLENNQKHAIDWLNKAAAEGSIDAQLELAKLYISGDIIEQNIEKGVAIISKYALNKFPKAIFQQGKLYEKGIHYKQNFSKAISLYAEAMALGSYKAAFYLADIYEQGNITEKNLSKAEAILTQLSEGKNLAAHYRLAAFKERQSVNGVLPHESIVLYKISAKGGYKPAQLKLAELFIYGNGVEQDFIYGLNILDELSDAGMSDASIKAGELFFEGYWLPKDHELSLEYFLSAVQQNNNNDKAKMKLADLYAYGDDSVRDFNKAEKMYRDIAAEGNDISANYKLARLFETMLGSDAITAEIAELYYQAAQAGYVLAVIRYADLQLEGIGVQQNVKEAVKVYKNYAQKGNGSAMMRLAKIYEYGILENKKYRKALSLYQKAVELGYELAYLEIARIYIEGNLLPVNYKISEQIYKHFINKKNTKASYLLAELYSRYQDKVTTNWQKLAISCYRHAAFSGYIEANYSLALLLDSMDRKYTREAMKNLYTAAYRGHHKAMILYGERLFFGIDIPKNQVEGLALILTAVRLQASGSIKKAMQLMESVDKIMVIDQANNRSLELKQTLLAPSLKHIKF